MTETSRRFRLKERTAEAHRRVDEKIGSFDSARSYGRYLVGLYSFRYPIEQALIKVVLPRELGDWRPTWVSSAIRADLNALGLEAPGGLAAHDGFNTSSSLFGCLYVLEGSGFGARILRTRAHALGLSDTFGASHLAAQASSASWSGFVSALEETPDLDIDIAVSAAIEAFAAAEAAFAELEYA
ncbi:MAG: biliverdin-producing heme oxygenase [Pseudomonadota bacterium]|jgi:heme oxygenase